MVRVKRTVPRVMILMMPQPALWLMIQVLPMPAIFLYKDVVSSKRVVL
jgi:hypothetical protein